MEEQRDLGGAVWFRPLGRWGERGFPPPLMAERLAAAGLVVLGLILLLGLLRGTQASPDALYIAEGYVKRVERLLQEGALTLEQGGRGTGVAGKIVYSEGDASPASRSFFEHSGRLRRDIEAYNESGQGAFLVRQGKLEIDRQAHNVPMPYPERRGWEGALTFVGKPLPSLANPRVTLAFRPAPLGDGLRELGHESWAEPAGILSQSAGGYRLLDERRRALCELRLLGGQGGEEEAEQVVLVVLRDDVAIAINGIEVNRGPRDGISALKGRIPGMGLNTFPLIDGDRVQVRLAGGTVYFRFGLLSDTLISSTRLLNGKEVRDLNGAAAKVFPMAEQIDDALQRYARSVPIGGGIAQPTVELTIDRPLQGATQTALIEFLDDYDRRVSSYPDIRARPGAITVLDALTGRALALASYPTPSQVEELEAQSRRGSFPELSDGQINRLRLNQNLAHIPIGSTIKPLLALAIWDAFPELRRLVVTGGQRNHSLYGHPLSAAYSNVGSGSSWNGVQFLTQSSNPYIVNLLFASLATPGSYQVGPDGILRYPGQRLDVSRFVSGNRLPKGLAGEEVVAFRRLADLFDIDLVPDFSSSSAAFYERSFLAPMLDQLGVPAGELPAPFLAVSPARPNLRLQAAETVRGDLVSLALGGATNRWANVKLAEAVARIGTGRAITAHLVTTERERVGEVDEMPPLIRVAPEAIGQVRQGMAGAVREGTLSAVGRGFRPGVDELVREMAAHGLEVLAYGKTGTAARVADRDCAAVIFFLGIQRPGGELKAAVSCSIYLEDRAEQGMSGNAVTLAGKIFADLAYWLKGELERSGELPVGLE
jgi:cell division protein FtsI/penicillin-binding protein 2